MWHQEPKQETKNAIMHIQIRFAGRLDKTKTMQMILRAKIIKTTMNFEANCGKTATMIKKQSTSH